MSARCEHCWFYRPNTATGWVKMECRRYPPQTYYTIASGLHTRWPSPSLYDGCGEFKQRPPEPPAPPELADEGYAS